jgi:hypothetical protein
MSIRSSSDTISEVRAPGRAEIAAVLVVTQASLSLVAGMSAIPFAIVEPGFRILSLLTILTAAGMFWLARGIRRQRRWARRWLIAMEALSLLATLLLSLLPIQLLRGPVPLLVNLLLPAAVLWLLLRRGSDARGAA